MRHPSGVSEERDSGGVLLEREEQLELIGAVLERAGRGEGGGLLVEGTAGLGKTALLDAGALMAADRGVRVLRTRGLELELEHPFGAVRRLLAPLAEIGGDLFGGAAALASPVLADSDAGGRGVAGFAALHGLYWLVAGVAGRGPVALLVDDAHWLDEASARFVAFLLPRIEELPAALVVARRPDGAGIDAAPDTRLTRLQPLSEPAVARLVAAALDRDDLELAQACAETTGGNPFFLTQVLAELRGVAEEPSAERVRRLAPAGASRAVLAQLAGLGADAVAVARAVAVAGEGVPLHLLARLGELDIGRARGAADALIAAGMLNPAPAPAFVHPLVRQAVREDMAPFQRAEAHRRAARLLDDAGAGAEAVAAQLLDSAPEGEAWAVQALRRAAAGAMRRGAPAIAADLLERAAAEPPPSAERASVLLELAAAETLAGRPSAAEHLRAVMDADPAPAERAQAAAALGRLLALTGRPEEAIGLLERELGAAGRELAPVLLAELLSVAQVHPATRPRLHDRLHDLRTARFSADTPVGRRLLAMQGLERALACDPVGEALASTRAALAGGRLLAEETADSPTYQEAVNVLSHVGECEQAERLRDAAIADAGARGSVFAYALSSAFRGIDRLRAGRLLGAEGDLRAGLELVREHYPPGVPLILTFLVEALAARGDLPAAREALAELGPRDDHPWPELWCSARGRLRLVEGDPAGAAEDLVAATRIWEGFGVRHTMFDADGARALVQSGRPELASQLAERELTGARRSGAPRLLGTALRAAGVAAPGDEGIAPLGEAVEVLARSSLKLELAGALVDLGAALRRAGRRTDARAPLRDGLDLAAECGAEPLRQRAADELEILGARPRKVVRRGADALTPSERRVAQMAASGMQNREIAQALFVTVKTVETQLSSAYRKLGVVSRRELPRALS